MAISKKGLRTIIVDEKKLYWKFDGKIIITQEAYKNAQLIVNFGWFDSFLYLNDPENKPPDFEPKVVKPQFVREAILFAIGKGWGAKKMEIEFKEGIFQVKEN